MQSRQKAAGALIHSVSPYRTVRGSSDASSPIREVASLTSNPERRGSPQDGSDVLLFSRMIRAVRSIETESRAAGRATIGSCRSKDSRAESIH